MKLGLCRDLFAIIPKQNGGENKMKSEMKTEILLNVEELEERIAPSATNASGTGKHHGSTPEVPVGAHPQPNPNPNSH